MHEGVLRDDARRAAKAKAAAKGKLREREEALEASREKQRIYEGVQRVERMEHMEHMEPVQKG
jgi:hypothetical protein